MKTTYMLIIFLFLFNSAHAQGTKERIKVHSNALEGNLIGDSATRDVTVYLPPSYEKNKKQRYPVLYMLHGFTDSDSQWFGWEDHWINLHALLDSAIANGQSKEMIVVMPNAYNSFKGSMYSSSATIGDWETFVVDELVSYTDNHYRTLPHMESRGLAGHSMGGYGTIRLGMKYPGVFSSVYMLSPCCMEGIPTENSELAGQLAEIKTPEDMQEASFFVAANMATAAAWSPNPENPPLYLDLPYDEEGKVNTMAASKIAANRILYTVDQYIFNLKQLQAIGMDAGTKDANIHASTKKLHEILEKYDIQHQYESYEGDHLNRIAERITTRTLPFFSKHLKFE